MHEVKFMGHVVTINSEDMHANTQTEVLVITHNFSNPIQEFSFGTIGIYSHVKQLCNNPIGCEGTLFLSQYVSNSECYRLRLFKGVCVGCFLW